MDRRADFERAVGDRTAAIPYGETATYVLELEARVWIEQAFRSGSPT
jgi:hypothetical protein